MATRRPAPAPGGPPGDGYTRLAGVVHVHTTLSDGGGTPEQVVAAARGAGLGYVAITDHNNLDAKAIEGRRDGVLVVVGSEISTTAGHVLGLGLAAPGYRFSGDAEDVLDDVRELGGFAFAAHPDSPRADFRFTGWALPGPWGLELLNGDTQWREAGLGPLLLTAALYPLNPRYALLRSLTPPGSTLERWDRLLATRDVPGIAGADAHARLPLSRRFAPPFPGYQALFALVRNHVLLEAPLSGDAAKDVRAVADALGRGRSYIGVDALADASGFSFFAEAGGRRYTMGDTLAAAADVRLRAGGSLPAGARLRLLKDGRPFREGQGGLDAEPAGAGVYRVEASLPGSALPFVISNPIYLFGAEQAALRAQAAAWRGPPPAPSPALLLADFERDGFFSPEFDPSSEMEREVAAPGAGPAGSRAARLAFRLGQPTPGRPHAWCALVNREPRDLSGHTGLVLALRGDASRRVFVQLRDRNPASADGGEEWWFASLKATPQWRRVAVPFSRLRSLNPKSDGRLDLDALVGLVLLVDLGAAEPGARGTLWIDELGVY